jgi:hypothetical protein
VALSSSGARLTIDREQRAAIYEDVTNHLSAIGDVDLLIRRGELETAQRLRREFEEDLRLLDDLGWASDDPRTSFELTMQLPELARALARLSAEVSEALRLCTERDHEEEEMAASYAVSCSVYGLLLGRVAERVACPAD